MNINNDQLEKVLSEYEQTLDWKRSGEIEERVLHVLSQYRSIADNSIYETKRVMEDVKTQFKAIEIITEGLTDEGMNHTQKRVIANHIISTLRRCIDKLDGYEYKYSTQNFERYNFFRSSSPERKLHEERRELKSQNERQQKIIDEVKRKHPTIINEIETEIPF